MLEVKLLGQFEVRLSGRLVLISARPAQTLFAYLVMHTAATHRREKLAALLWPDSDEGSARHNLRQALWQVRRALGPQSDAAYILADELTVGFNPRSDYRLDVAVLEDATTGVCTVDDLSTATSLYGGELLPGFYDDWVILERERLEALFDRVAGDLLDAYLAEARWAEARDWAQRWIALGHVPEPAYQGLMQAHTGLGDVAAAASAFQRCRKALREQLGVEPSQRTLELYASLTQQGAAVRSSGKNGRAAQEANQAAGPDESQCPAAPGPPPFKGLRCFEEVDASQFFGREALTERLAFRLRKSARVLVIVGASGSGKSSLVRAGLVPALLARRPEDRGAEAAEQRTDFAQEYLLLTPTAHPVQALAAALARDAQSLTSVTALMDDMLADPRCFGLAAERLLSERSKRHDGRGAGADRLLVVIDQFEEVFTLCRDEPERQAFLDNVLAALDGRSPVTLVVALRADFYANCAAYPRLRAVLSTAQEFIGPMSAEELRRAIEGPARQGGWEFEPGVADLILRDAGNEPGALPLLSHALLETWRNRSDRVLTLRSYVASGGVHGALARTAERILRELSAEEQAIARNIFVRLTELGEGAPDTRRRACLDELAPRPDAAPAVRAILERLASARLVTVNEDTVEVAHEALIREWPTLRAWLATDREGLRLYRRLTEAATSWAELDRDPGELYQGARLAQTADWAAEHAEELNPLEQEFLQASLAWQEHKAAEQDEMRRREFEAVRVVAETQTRAARALRRRALLLSGALTLAAVLAVVAIAFARQAEEQTRFARAREWAAAAINNLTVDPERSVLLSLEAVKEARASGGRALPEAENALHQAVSATRVRMTLSGHVGAVAHLAFSPDGTRLATIGQDGYLKVWDTASGKLVQNVLAHPAGNGFDVAFSFDGAILATSARGDDVRTWDARTGAALQVVRFPENSYAADPPVLTFSPHSDQLIVTDGRLNAGIYEASTGLRATGFQASDAMQLPRASWWVRDVAVNPQGTLLANTQYRMETPDAGNGARVFDLASGRTLLALTPPWPKMMNSVAFSPDGTQLLVSTNEQKAEIWDIASGNLLQTFTGHTAEVESAVFSPDGKRIATGSLDGTARVWEASTGRELLVLAGHSQGVLAVAFMPGTDGLVLATASADGTARLWDLSTDREWSTFAPPGSASLSGMALSRDGQWLATADTEGSTAVWYTPTWTQAFKTTSALDSNFQGLPINRVAFSPDGQQVAISPLDGVITVRDAHSGSIRTKIASPFLGGVRAIAFSPDGTRLVTGNDARSVSVWDTATGERIAVMLGHRGTINGAAISPDGRRVASGSANGEVKLWDMTSGKELRSLENQGEGIWAVAFSPDGRWLATGSRNGAVSILAADTLESYRVLLGHTTDVRALAWSPDSTLLASGSADTTVKVWDVGAGEELYTLHGHKNLVSELAFSGDGSRLVSAGYDGTVRFYLPRLDDLVLLARSRVTRTLTPDECAKYLHLASCPAGP